MLSETVMVAESLRSPRVRTAAQPGPWDSFRAVFPVTATFRLLSMWRAEPQRGCLRKLGRKVKEYLPPEASDWLQRHGIQ